MMGVGAYISFVGIVICGFSVILNLVQTRNKTVKIVSYILLSGALILMGVFLGMFLMVENRN